MAHRWLKKSLSGWRRSSLAWQHYRVNQRLRVEDEYLDWLATSRGWVTASPLSIRCKTCAGRGCWHSFKRRGQTRHSCLECRGTGWREGEPIARPDRERARRHVNETQYASDAPAIRFAA